LQTGSVAGVKCTAWWEKTQGMVGKQEGRKKRKAWWENRKDAPRKIGVPNRQWFQFYIRIFRKTVQFH
jgi:hypothetical protein